MPGPYRKKKTHFGDTHLQRRWRTRNRKKDLDEVILSLYYIFLIVIIEVIICCLVI